MALMEDQTRMEIEQRRLSDGIDQLRQELKAIETILDEKLNEKPMPRLIQRWPIFFGALLTMLGTAAGTDLAAAPFSSPATTTNALDYALIITGGELLHGAFPDGHTAFLTRTLHPLGLHCVGSMIVDDHPEDIAEALRFATNEAPLVIVTGGLGPTGNDVTRQALADFTGVAVRENAELLAELSRRLQTPVEKLRENLRRQTRVPERGTFLRNPNGTAAGLVFDLGRIVIVALPGPPRELQPMTRHELVPYLTRRFGTRPPGCRLTLRFVGLGQSQIDQTLTEHVPPDRDIILASQFEGGRVDFTFSLPGDSPPERARLRQLEKKILQHLGPNIYADDEATLEDVVLRALRERRATLALVEVASGGALAASLSQSAHATNVVSGAWSAPTLAQARRLVSADVAALPEIARAARTASGATAAVVIGERLPANGGSVEVFVDLPGPGAATMRLPLRGSDGELRSALVTQVLDQLRRRLDLKVTPRAD